MNEFKKFSNFLCFYDVSRLSYLIELINPAENFQGQQLSSYFDSCSGLSLSHGQKYIFLNLFSLRCLLTNFMIDFFTRFLTFWNISLDHSVSSFSLEKWFEINSRMSKALRIGFEIIVSRWRRRTRLET